MTKLIPEDLIKKHNILPLGTSNGKLKVIIGDPSDLETIDAIRFRLNTEPECYLGNPTKIRNYIENTIIHVQAAHER